MSHRFSFDNDDEASFAPKNTHSQPEPQFQSARGRDYEQYAPRALSPAGSYHDDAPLGHTGYDHSASQAQQPYHIPPPLEPAQRDPHNITAPVPPPHRQMSSQDSRGAAAGYGAATGFGAGAAADTAYHGAGNDYQDYQPYNPFEYADRSSLQPPAHGYPEYPQNPLEDPFASNRSSYNNLAASGGSGAQPRPGLEPRPNSFTNPYGSYDHAASSGDLGNFDPRDIADEDDDTGAYAMKQKNSRGVGGAAAAGMAGAAGAAAAAGGFIKGPGSRDASGKYGAVPGGEPEKGMNIVGKASQGKRRKWLVAALIVGVIVLACIGGGVGAYFELHKDKSGSSSSSDGSGSSGGDFDLKSSEIKKLMNNKALHKIFPGIDYTPYNAQYPDCLSNMPSQNNITMDVAVLSQLTPQIRLYGTDCNQVEMVLEAIDKLQLKDEVKVWLGVYLDGNKTTNDRQMSQMWTVLDKAGSDPFQGVIVGNEVLFSQYMPKQQLIDTIGNVKKNLTSKNIKLPVATSDLGVSWDETLAQPVDYVMANVHPVRTHLASNICTILTPL